MPYQGLQNKESTRKPYSGLTGVKYEEPEGIGSKVVKFGKEIAKDAVSTLLVKPTARATEAITRTLAPNSMAAKGYEAMADEGQSQKFLGGIEIKPQKAFGQGGGKQIAGQALESASWLIGGGKAAQTATKLGGKQMVKQLVKEGALASTTGSAGYQLQDKGKIDLKQTAKDVALGTVLTPLAGYGVNKLFGKKASSVIETKVANDIHNQVTGGRITDESLNYLKKNPIGVDELPVNKDGTVTLYRNGNIEGGKPQSYSLRQGEGQIPVNIPKENVLVNYNSNKVDELYNKSFTKEQIDAGYLNQRKLNKLESEVYAISPEEKILEKKIQQPQPIKREEVVLNESPEFKDLDPEVKKTTFQEIRSNYDTLSKTTSVDDLIDISMGKKEVPQGLTKTSIYELTKNRKDLTVEQVKRLKNVAPESEAGLNLATVKLRDGGIIDNPTDFIQATEKIMKDKASKSGITKKTISRFLDDIECK